MSESNLVTGPASITLGVPPVVASEPPAMSAAPPDPAPAPAKIHLDEYCIRASKKRVGVEILAAFCATEGAAGTTHDTEAAFEARFVKLCNTPA